MTAKKWTAAFFITAAVFALLILALNVLVDPFGVFGDPIFHWDSYSETQNPRIGKIAYLDREHEKYDSYIIGCSSTSSYSTELLNEYYGASFYNLIMYGADMQDVRDMVYYIADNYEVKNLVVNVYIDNGLKIGQGEDSLSSRLPAKISGRSPLSYYADYVFLNPNYAVQKIKDRAADTLLSQPFDVFNVETGFYDKRARDVEPIGSLEDYYRAYPAFADYPVSSPVMQATDETMKCLSDIRDLCLERGISFAVVSAPVYWDYFNDFSRDEVEHFYESLAEVTDFWDFTMSSVSFEPRYFYDATHFRNNVGRWAVMRMFGEESEYIPADFGRLVTKDNVPGAVAAMYSASGEPADNSAKVPILTYHHITDTGNGDTEISEEAFRAQMAALSEMGYTSVFFSDLESYVNYGTPLPEKPVVITFDDGYMSNYSRAFPILEEYGMKATVFVIGVSVGSTEHYKDTEFPITPHFGWDEAREMVYSGLVEIGSHTFDMHRWAPFEAGRARENILRFPDEAEEAYVAAVRADFKKSADEIERETGKRPDTLSFPSGKYDTLAQWALTTAGVRATVSVEDGIAEIVKGLPQSLYAMKRLNMTDAVTPEGLIELLEGV